MNQAVLQASRSHLSFWRSDRFFFLPPMLFHAHCLLFSPYCWPVSTASLSWAYLQTGRKDIQHVVLHRGCPWTSTGGSKHLKAQAVLKVKQKLWRWDPGIHSFSASAAYSKSQVMLKITAPKMQLKFMKFQLHTLTAVETSEWSQIFGDGE